MSNRVVWAEIPVTDLDKAGAFYAAVLQHPLTRNDAGPNPMMDLPGGEGQSVSGHLYPGKPGAAATVHMMVPDSVEEAAERCTAQGGTLAGPVIQIPAGRFQYAQDPDGNWLGLYQRSAV